MTETLTPAQKADILEQAADLLETVGHAKGISVQRNKATQKIVGYCATGAIYQAILQDDGRYNALHWDALTEELAVGVPDQFKRFTHQISDGGGFIDFLCGEKPAISIVQGWNDNEATTSSEVIDLMKHTAKDLRNQGGAA